MAGLVMPKFGNIKSDKLSTQSSPSLNIVYPSIPESPVVLNIVKPPSNIIHSSTLNVVDPLSLVLPNLAKSDTSKSIDQLIPREPIIQTKLPNYALTTNCILPSRPATSRPIKHLTPDIPLRPSTSRPCRSSLLVLPSCSKSSEIFEEEDEDDDDNISDGRNPWIPISEERSDYIRITGLTPLGNIISVPTSNQRIENRKLDVLLNDNNDVEPDPILKATILLDCTKSTDRDYHYVSNKMKRITQNIINLQKQYTNKLLSCPSVKGKVTSTKFKQYLSIYENNQVFYQDKLDDKTMTLDNIKIALTNLEHWFMAIIEPKPPRDEIDMWREREKSKITTKRSPYCDPELYEYITPASDELINYISEQHIKYL